MEPSTSASLAFRSILGPRTLAELDRSQLAEALAALDLSRSIRTILFSIPFFIASVAVFFLACAQESIALLLLLAAFGSMPLSLIAVPRMAALFLRSELQSLSLDPELALELSVKFKGMALRTARQRRHAVEAVNARKD